MQRVHARLKLFSIICSHSSVIYNIIIVLPRCLKSHLVPTASSIISLFPHQILPKIINNILTKDAVLIAGAKSTDDNQYISFFKEILGIEIKNPEIILWSFSEKQKNHKKGVLKELVKAR